MTLLRFRGHSASKQQVAFATVLALCSFAPAQDPELQETEQELAHLFDPPQGRVIGDHGGPHLPERVRAESEKDPVDFPKPTLWGERMTPLYNDPSMLARFTSSVTQRVADPMPFRVAIANGVLQSELGARQQDDFLRGLYGGDQQTGAAARGSVPVTALRTRPAPGAAASAGSIEVGDVVEPLEIFRTQNTESVDLAALRGEVVVLDSFATWCPPFRCLTPSPASSTRGSLGPGLGFARFPNDAAPGARGATLAKRDAR